LSANKKQPADQFFTLASIQELEIHAELVTLAACQTSFGKDVVLEGSQSLSRAFLSVGAHRVLSTLWEADASVTTAFLLEFYQEYAKPRVSAAAALRTAQLKFRRSKDPEASLPMHWAAFVLNGER